MGKIKSKTHKVSKVSKISKTVHKSGFFSGRLNRSGFVIGSLVVVFVSVIVVMLLYPLLFKISHVASVVFPFLMLIVASIYGVSLTLRRFHDLNRNGLWLLIYLPTALLELYTLAYVAGSLIFGPHSSAEQGLFATLESIKSLIGILAFLTFVSTFSLFYLVARPGYKKVNKWGHPVKHWKLKEILGWK